MHKFGGSILCLVPPHPGPHLPQRASRARLARRWKITFDPPSQCPLRPRPLSRAVTRKDEPPGSEPPLLDDAVGQMGDTRSVHNSGNLQFHAAGLDPINQASAASEHGWHQGDCQLVQKARS